MEESRIVQQYEANYGISGVSIEQARSHWELELDLTRQLLQSQESDRWDTFERCYDQLYAGLPWLANTGGQSDVGRWLALVGEAPRRIYEIGSGAGKLAGALAAAGHQVEATDVSRHRGDRDAVDRLTWTVTDGVHLDQFAQAAPYDIAISDQVVEHLHPDDIAAHCESCFRLLRPGGQYIVRTPNRLNGPHDVSRVFGFDQPKGMHLREYTATELAEILARAGFGAVDVVVPLDRTSRIVTRPRVTSAYFAMERALERMGPALRSRALSVLKGPMYPNVWMVATR